ncbi:MAG: AmmeMemoRadiSam system protein B [Alphaproteobacteria bacterium HGW-Alphaproteobacteria-10]|nr:MAG: AmmeMemoRadiSam system protein B [Alphaproteobacteria bacterium HGW-Alphaproteobacteria-10]
MRERPFPAAYPGGLFLDAMEAAESRAPASGRVSGLVLPHHLLAADLIAKGFAHVREGGYRRIVIFSPDHFSRGKTSFSVPGRDFLTSLGPVPLDREGAAALLRSELVSESSLFSHEHGVQALLPFIARHFPGAFVLPVAIGKRSTPEEWRALAELLAPHLGDDTLIVQSTDFSHYLDREETSKRDAESLAVLLSGDPERAVSLRQPAHIDSRGALFVQMTLQKSMGATPVLLAHASSFEYNSAEAEKTGGTSYITAIYISE